MKTIDHSVDELSAQELFGLVNDDEILIKTKTGKTYFLVQLDEFEEEVIRLSQNKKFISFLKERSKNRARHTIGDVKKELGLE